MAKSVSQMQSSVMNIGNEAAVNPTYQPGSLSVCPDSRSI